MGQRIAVASSEFARERLNERLLVRCSADDREPSGALLFLCFRVSTCMRTTKAAFAEFKSTYAPNARLNVTLVTGETWRDRTTADIVARIARRLKRGERVEIIAIEPSREFA